VSATESTANPSVGTTVLRPQSAVRGDDRGATDALIALQHSLDLAPDRSVVIVGDVDGFVLAGPIDAPSTRELLAETCDQIAAHAQPVIAALPGPALDAGLELALACDLRFAGGSTAVGFPAGVAGQLPTGGAQRLVRLAGSALAARLLLLGGSPRVGDEPALARALHTSDDPVADALAAARTLEARAPLALEAIKLALRAANDLPLTAGLALEADLACLLMSTEDRAEGLRAHRAGEPPAFSGR
jgi:enoyl-CoA hydratase/carnithine racemase